MKRTTIYLEKKELDYIKQNGYTLSGFVRKAINDLKYQSLTKPVSIKPVTHSIISPTSLVQRVAELERKLEQKETIPNKERLKLCKLLIKNKWSNQKIIGWLALLPDFDRKITIFQLNELRRQIKNGSS